jgi:cytochrome b6-f complex iron-sulfur subunit
MEREDFLKAIGLGVITLGVVSCTNNGSIPIPSKFGTVIGSGNGNGNNALVSLDITTQLLAVGDAHVKGNIIVVRTAIGNVASSFVALSEVCPHAGCLVNYFQTNQSFVCPCHDSIFTVTGDLVQGPAVTGLTKYTVTINGSSLIVS